MYHRFEENKYPSTNIRINEFKKHIELINQENIKIINPSNFYNELKNNTNQRKILLTIDDGFLSFYDKAWPMLKKIRPLLSYLLTLEKSVVADT